MCSLFLMVMQFYDNDFEVGEGVKGGFDGILQRRKKWFYKKNGPPCCKNLYTLLLRSTVLPRCKKSNFILISVVSHPYFNFKRLKQ